MKKVLLAIFSTVLSVHILAGEYIKNTPETVVQRSLVYPDISNESFVGVDEENPIPGARALLERSTDGIKVVVSTNSLEEGLYTLWLQVFNRPDLCVEGEISSAFCSRRGDLARVFDPCVPDANNLSTCSVFWLASMIVGPDGVGHVSAEVGVREWPGFVILGADRSGDQIGITDPFGSELQIVLRTHGKALLPDEPVFMFEDSTQPDPVSGMPALRLPTQAETEAYAQIGRQYTRLLGGCFPPLDGDRFNLCADNQLAFFPPVYK